MVYYQYKVCDLPDSEYLALASKGIAPASKIEGDPVLPRTCGTCQTVHAMVLPPLNSDNR